MGQFSVIFSDGYLMYAQYLIDKFLSGQILKSGGQKEIGLAEMKKIVGLVILIGIHQSTNENIFQLWSK